MQNDAACRQGDGRRKGGEGKRGGRSSISSFLAYLRPSARTAGGLIQGQRTGGGEGRERKILSLILVPQLL